MPTWRCPHCGTPQAETARCWVCRRSSTACGTCRHFRRSVAGHLGYCGLDRRRSPLSGEEIRACWEPTPVIVAETRAVAGSPLLQQGSDGAGRRARDFVEVVPTADGPMGPAPMAGPPADPTRGRPRRVATSMLAHDSPGEVPPGEVPPSANAAPAEPRWNLWGDLER